MSVKNTIYEMFQQRNYTEIKDENHGFLAKKPDNSFIIAFYDIIEKLNTDELKHFISRADEYKVNHMILVYREKTPQIKTVETHIENTEKKLELFFYADLLINCTKHSLVPQHILCSAEEKREVKEKIKSLSLLPVLLRTDAVCRFYGFQKGDLIKIIRKSGHITYRIVK